MTSLCIVQSTQGQLDMDEGKHQEADDMPALPTSEKALAIESQVTGSLGSVRFEISKSECKLLQAQTPYENKTQQPQNSPILSLLMHVLSKNVLSFLKG